ncbi:hypothetical protein AAMO2058_001197300 [Amorphochlora amoebiformis]
MFLIYSPSRTPTAPILPASTPSSTRSPSSPARLRLSSPSPPTPCMPVRGLKNLGNTCFFNSVVQQLAHCPMFHQAVDATIRDGTTTGIEKDITRSLGELMTAVRKEGGGRKPAWEDPSHLWQQIVTRVPSFGKKRQQDALELLKYLLEALNEESIPKGAKKSPPSDQPPTVVDRTFGGYLSSTVVCGKCHQRTTTDEKFLELSLPLGNGSDKKETLQKEARNPRSGQDSDNDITDCLRNFFKEEEVNGYRCTHCCDGSTPRADRGWARKRVCIKRRPKVLVLHLKRYSQTPRKLVRKIQTKIRPPTLLDLSSFTFEVLPTPDLSREGDVPPESLDLGSRIDCRDAFGMWLVAQIVEKRGDRVRVRFEGWSAEFDEVLNLNVHKLRIAPLGTYTASRNSQREFKLGELILAFAPMPFPGWVKGVVAKKCSQQIRIDFVCQGPNQEPKKIQYWFHSTSPELRPLASDDRGHVSPPFRHVSPPFRAPVPAQTPQPDEDLDDSEQDDEVFQKYKKDAIQRAKKKAYDKSAEQKVGIDVCKEALSLYRLSGLVCHGGSMLGGHYVSYVRVRSRNEWYMISDTKVRHVEAEEVVRKQAYLLFYELFEPGSNGLDLKNC